MPRQIVGLYLTPEGDAIQRPLEVRERDLLSKREKLAWVQEVDPFIIRAARRGQHKRLVIVTGEHASPLRPPWMDPAAPAPAQKARLRERNRTAVARAMKEEGARTDFLLLIYICILLGVLLLLCLVVVAFLPLGGVFDWL